VADEFLAFVGDAPIVATTRAMELESGPSYSDWHELNSI
jgi:hypothetical protein